jgi:hypothetical protein
MLSAIYKPFMLSVIYKPFMLSVVMLNVVILSVVEPYLMRFQRLIDDIRQQKRIAIMDCEIAGVNEP